MKHVKSWSKPAIKKIDKHNYAIILSGACKDNKKDQLKRERIESELREKLKSKNITVKILYKKNSMDRSEIPCELLIDIINQFNNNKNYCTYFNTKKIKSIKLSKWVDKKPNINKMVKEGAI